MERNHRIGNLWELSYTCRLQRTQTLRTPRVYLVNTTNLLERLTGKAKRVLRYLKGSAQTGIVFKSQQNPLTDFVDADWDSSIDDRRLFTGYAFVWNGGIIS